MLHPQHFHQKKKNTTFSQQILYNKLLLIII